MSVCCTVFSGRQASHNSQKTTQLFGDAAICYSLAHMYTSKMLYQHQGIPTI
jgi:hypothetical protein